MTTEHYDWAKNRIRSEVQGSHSSSIWLALAIGVAGVGATLCVTLASAMLSAVSRGEIEVAAIACGVVTALLIVVHFVFWRGSARRADDLIKELELHTMPVIVQPSNPEAAEWLAWRTKPSSASPESSDQREAEPGRSPEPGEGEGTTHA